MNDDQPYLIDTDSGPIVSTPYTNEINDFTILTRRGHTTDEMRDILIEELKVLHHEASKNKTGKMMNVGLHPLSSLLESREIWSRSSAISRDDLRDD